MTTNLGTIYSDVLYRLGKDYRGGYIGPAKFNAAIRVINERALNALVDSFEQTKEVTSDLEPFIKTYGSAQFPALNFTPVLTGDNSKGGYTEPPSDYWYHVRSFYIKTTNDGCDTVSDYTPVEFVSQHIADDKLASSIESPVKNPTENYPISFFMNGLIYIYPYLKRISWTQIREALRPIFDYDIISGMAVYLPPGETHVNDSVLPTGTPSQSVEFEYQESMVDKLTQDIVVYLAIANQVEWNLKANPQVK